MKGLQVKICAVARQLLHTSLSIENQAVTTKEKAGTAEKGDSPPDAEGRWNRYPVEYSIVAFNEKGGSGEKRHSLLREG